MRRVRPATNRLVSTANIAGYRDGLSGLSFSDAEIGRDRRQQAYRHEFGCDQHGDAERHGSTAPQAAAAGQMVLYVVSIVIPWRRGTSDEFGVPSRLP